MMKAEKLSSTEAPRMESKVLFAIPYSSLPSRTLIIRLCQLQVFPYNVLCPLQMYPGHTYP